MYCIDKIDEIPQFIFKNWFTNLVTIYSTNTWAILSLLTLIFGLVVFLIYFFSFKLKVKKLSFYLATVLIGIAILSFAFSAKSKNIVLHTNGAIVMQPTVTLKSSPRQTGTNLFVVHEGTKVYIISQLDNWYEIKLTDGKQGWLEKSDVEPI
jgi:hypothetical protein